MPEPAAKILVVDDSVETVDHVAGILGGAGYDVLKGFDGDEAIGIAKRERPDLILLDLVMPRLHGLSACRILRADSTLDSVPILMLTSESDVESIVHGFASGANDYLIKPARGEELLARVRRHLSTRDAHREAVSTERLLAIGQIALSVQHEINNPLAAVIGFLDLALRAEDVPERTRKHLALARAAAERISEVVDRLGDVEDKCVDPYGVGGMIDLSSEPEATTGDLSTKEHEGHEGTV